MPEQIPYEKLDTSKRHDILLNYQDQDIQCMKKQLQSIKFRDLNNISSV